jgi:hypothetical protein
LELQVKAIEGAARPDDLATHCMIHGRAVVENAFDAVAPLFPASTFAFAHFEVDLARFLTALFQRPEVFAPAEVRLLTEQLNAIPELGDIAGLVRKLDECCRGGVSIGFFTQDRDPGDKPAAGFALALPLRDEERLRSTIDAINRRIRSISDGGARSGLKDLVASRDGTCDLFDVVLAEGIVDDPTVTRIGFAIAQGHLVITNFFPSLRGMQTRLDGITPHAGKSERFRRALAQVSDDVRIGWILDGEAIYAYFDQSARGWAHEQTRATPARQILWRGEAEVAARNAGLQPGTEPWTKYVDEHYARRDEASTTQDRPAREREIRAWLGYFRGLVDDLGLHISGTGAGLELAIRFDLAHPVPR